MQINDQTNQRTRGLGRGLDALIPMSEEGQTSSGGVKQVDVNIIKPNPQQPRKTFNELALAELAESIREHGIIQPLVVTKSESGGYELIAGERRLRASKLLGLTEVPVIVRDEHEIKKLELAITENVQRDDLNPIEEAYAYQELVTNFSYSQEEVAHKIGKSRSAIANKLRLLSLPAEVKKAIRNNEISEGHGRALLALNSPEKITALLKIITDNSLSVRDTEQRVNEILSKSITRVSDENEEQIEAKDPNILKLEEELRNLIGLKTKIKQRRGGKGTVAIDYNSLEDLDNILNFFTKK